MSQLRDALERSGLLPKFVDVQAPLRDADRMLVTDYAALPDDVLIAQIEAAKVDAADILRQLDDDKAEGLPRGEAWRSRARRKRREFLRQIDLMSPEIRRREDEGKRAAREAAQQRHQDEMARGRAARLAREQRNARVDQIDGRLFIVAARQILTGDQMQQIGVRVAELKQQEDTTDAGR